MLVKDPLLDFAVPPFFIINIGNRHCWCRADWPHVCQLNIAFKGNKITKLFSLCSKIIMKNRWILTTRNHALTHGVRLFWARKTNGYELLNPCFYDQIGAFAKHSAVFGAERSRNVNVIAVTSKHQQSWPFWAQTREKSPPRYNSNICRKI